MRKPITNRLPQEYKKLRFNLTLRFYISITNNRLEFDKLKEYIEYTTI